MKYILIADSDGLHRNLMQKSLDKAGHSVHICSNGMEMIQKMATFRYDLIIADGLVFEESMDFTIWMSKSDYYRQVPVIFLVTATANVILYSDVSKRLKIHTLLPKPYMPDKLLNLINMYFSFTHLRTA